MHHTRNCENGTKSCENCRFWTILEMFRNLNFIMPRFENYTTSRNILQNFYETCDFCNVCFWCITISAAVCLCEAEFLKMSLSKYIVWQEGKKSISRIHKYNIQKPDTVCLWTHDHILENRVRKRMLAWYPIGDDGPVARCNCILSEHFAWSIVFGHGIISLQFGPIQQYYLQDAVLRVVSGN